MFFSLGKTAVFTKIWGGVVGRILCPSTEGQGGELLLLVAVTDLRLYEDMGVVPNFGDDGCGGVNVHI